MAGDVVMKFARATGQLVGVTLGGEETAFGGGPRLVGGDGAMAKMVAYVSTPVWSRVMGPPEGPMVDGSARVRSGLTTSQVAPSSVDRWTTLEQ